MTPSKSKHRPAGLARGTEVRSARAALKRAIADGEVDGFEVLAGASERWEAVAAEMPLVALIAAVWGGNRTLAQIDAAKLLEERRIPSDARVYAVTVERRLELAHAARKEAMPR